MATEINERSRENSFLSLLCDAFAFTWFLTGSFLASHRHVARFMRHEINQKTRFFSSAAFLLLSSDSHLRWPMFFPRSRQHNSFFLGNNMIKPFSFLEAHNEFVLDVNTCEMSCLSPELSLTAGQPQPSTTATQLN